MGARGSPRGRGLLWRSPPLAVRTGRASQSGGQRRRPAAAEPAAEPAAKQPNVRLEFMKRRMEDPNFLPDVSLRLKGAMHGYTGNG